MNQDTNTHSGRYLLLAGLFVLTALVIVGRLFYVEASGQRETFDLKEKDWGIGYHIYYPPRGDVYDRYGKLLAGSEEAYEVGVDLNVVNRTHNAEAIAFTLKSVMADHPVYQGTLDYYNWVLGQVSATAKITDTYRLVADYVSVKELDELKKWADRYAALKPSNDPKAPVQSLSGLIYRPRMKRVYPEGTLAGNILGYVNLNGEGINGVEQSYNDLLAGYPIEKYYNRNPLNAGQMPKVPKGTDLILTLDRDIQAAVESILDKAVKDTGSAAGTILVMDPRNGEMLAIATTPHIDPNKFWEASDYIKSGGPFDRAVNTIYEPGSVFKVITMSAALNEGVVTPDTTFYDPGSIEVGGINIHNWDYGAYGEQNMVGCLQHSLNVCLAWVATQLKPEKFYQYVENFGFGHLTGVDLAGEVQGLVRKPGDKYWYMGDLGTNSYGQGLAVTPIQMMQAVSALANKGQMSAPHLLKSEVTDGRQFNPIRPVVGMPITPDTAHTITEMLATSLENEASNALVTGYRVAGKTGTASIATPTGYADGVTNASFVGWGPVDDPSILIYVWLEKPTSSIWGSVVAAPVFAETFKQVAVLTRLPPDEIRQQIASMNNQLLGSSPTK